VAHRYQQQASAVTSSRTARRARVASPRERQDRLIEVVVLSETGVWSLSRIETQCLPGCLFRRAANAWHVRAAAEEGAVAGGDGGDFALHWLDSASMDAKPEFRRGVEGGNYSGDRTRATHRIRLFINDSCTFSSLPVL
jgi:hypothetical protein